MIMRLKTLRESCNEEDRIGVGHGKSFDQLCGFYLALVMQPYDRPRA
jgi:hypothetical protein